MNEERVEFVVYVGNSSSTTEFATADVLDDAINVAKEAAGEWQYVSIEEFTVTSKGDYLYEPLGTIVDGKFVREGQTYLAGT